MTSLFVTILDSQASAYGWKNFLSPGTFILQESTSPLGLSGEFESIQGLSPLNESGVIGPSGFSSTTPSPSYTSAPPGTSENRVVNSPERYILIPWDSSNVNTNHFEPVNLTISKNTTVTWTNNDHVNHIIKIKDAENSSIDNQISDKLIELDPFGGSDNIIFDKEGNYSYFCSLHPHTTAVIQVMS